jgi:hypothetical protein
MKAIETSYKGYRFRSRLEARWAVYFDALGIDWEYEKEGYDLEGVYYLPDFWLPQVHMWAEVKAEQFTEPEIRKALLLSDHTGCSVLKLIGPPDCRAYAVVDYEHEDHNWDYVITNCVLSERRFWSGPGFDVMDELDKEGFPEVVEAVNAARSARFEFGQSGATHA